MEWYIDICIFLLTRKCMDCDVVAVNKGSDGRSVVYFSGVDLFEWY